MNSLRNAVAGNSAIGGGQVNSSVDTTNDASYGNEPSFAKKSKIGALDSLGPI